MNQPDPNELNWLHTAVRRLKQGEATALITETQAALQQQPGQIELLLTLALAYAWLGAGSEAEPVARQALAEVQRRGRAEKGHYWFPRYLDMGHLAVFDAVMAQGHFQEAARSLERHAPKAMQTNQVWAATTLAYFMAEDRQAASRTLESRLNYDPYGGNDYTSEQLDVTAKFRVMLGYINIQLLPRGLPRQFYLLSMRQRAANWVEPLASWEDEVQRNAHNPYGVRLAELVAALRAMIFKHNRL